MFLQWLRERNESLMKEVDSLNAVLEMRREEIDRLRIFEIEHGQLKDKLARSDDAIEKYKARIEDLSVSWWIPVQMEAYIVTRQYLSKTSI